MSIPMSQFVVSLFKKGYEYRGHGSYFLVSFDFSILTSQLVNYHDHMTSRLTYWEFDDGFYVWDSDDHQVHENVYT